MRNQDDDPFFEDESSHPPNNQHHAQPAQLPPELPKWEVKPTTKGRTRGEKATLNKEMENEENQYDCERDESESES